MVTSGTPGQGLGFVPPVSSQLGAVAQYLGEQAEEMRRVADLMDLVVRLGRQVGPSPQALADAMAHALIGQRPGGQLVAVQKVASQGPAATRDRVAGADETWGVNVKGGNRTRAQKTIPPAWKGIWCAYPGNSWGQVATRRRVGTWVGSYARSSRSRAKARRRSLRAVSTWARLCLCSAASSYFLA